jgi:hypothetical protein
MRSGGRDCGRSEGGGGRLLPWGARSRGETGRCKCRPAEATSGQIATSGKIASSSLHTPWSERCGEEGVDVGRVGGDCGGRAGGRADRGGRVGGCREAGAVYIRVLIVSRD